MPKGEDLLATTTRCVTDEELLQAPRDGQKHERVDGEIRVSPAGARHGAIIVRLTLRLGAFVVERQLGHLFESSTGFRWPGRKPDRPDDVLEKVGEYLDVGTRLVWVIDPERRTAAAYRSLTDVRVIGEADALDGADVVPGFSCLLRDVLG